MTILTVEQFKFIKVVTGLNAAKIAEQTKGTDLYVSKATIERFERGEVESDVATLRKLRKFLNPKTEEKGWQLTPTGGIDRIKEKEE